MFVLQSLSQLCLPPVIDKFSTFSVVENVQKGNFRHMVPLHITGGSTTRIRKKVLLNL